MSETSKMSSRWPTKWLAKWLHREPPASRLPLGLTEREVEALQWLVSTPQWPHFLRALEALAASQLSELTNGLAHDRYLFACGALTALRRVATFPVDVLASTANLKEIDNVRSRTDAARQQRTANAFLNTPWWDAFVRDSTRAAG